MLAKIWKKLGLVILIIVCLYSLIIKLTSKVSLNVELEATKSYVKKIQTDENETNQTNNLQ